MVPIYAAANFLQLVFYHHAVYYAVISDCYEAFAISSFFSLMCQYMAPTLHEQKQFFRQLSPIKPWVAPLNWFAACCGGNKGPWRTPKSGLTWFNIIWIGVYHYCFIRVAMTIVAVVTQHYEKYCESSMSPLFSHVWVRTNSNLCSLRRLRLTRPAATRFSLWSVLRSPLLCTASSSTMFSSK